MDIGYTYPFNVPGIGDIRRAATVGEDLGLASLWTGETRGTEIFSSLMLAGATAPRLSLGTGVIAIQLRGPLLTAMSAGTLQAAFPESEIYLGLGVSGPAVVQDWHGSVYQDKPVSQMREFVEVLRLCFAGEPFSHSGDFYTLKRSRMSIELGERRPKIIIGALNQRMLQLAGEVADGVLLNTLPASAIGWAVDQVREGERTGEREPGACRIHGLLRIGIGDREARLEIGRRSLFSYAVVDGYARSFARAGFGAEVELAQAEHKAGRRAEALAAISDHMVDSIEIVGDEQRMFDSLSAYVNAGIESPVIIPLLDETRPQESFAETLGAAARAAQRLGP